MMEEYEFDYYYQYWIEMQRKPLAVGQKIVSGILNGTGEKFGIIFRIKGEQKPESITVLHFFDENRKVSEDLRIGGSAFFDVVWQDGTITSRIPERDLRIHTEVMLIPEIADEEEIEQALKCGFPE